MVSSYKRLLAALAVLAALSPLGLLATGTAFGEWGPEELLNEVGYIPAGLAKYADFWRYALLPDYSIPGLDSGFFAQAVGYVASALLGMALVAVLVVLWTRLAGSSQNENQ